MSSNKPKNSLQPREISRGPQQELMPAPSSKSLLSVVQQQVELQKANMKKTSEQNAAFMSLVSQSFKDLSQVAKSLKEECTGMSQTLKQTLMLQTYVGENMLKELTSMNKYIQGLGQDTKKKQSSLKGERQLKNTTFQASSQFSLKVFGTESTPAFLNRAEEDIQNQKFNPTPKEVINTEQENQNQQQNNILQTVAQDSQQKQLKNILHLVQNQKGSVQARQSIIIKPLQHYKTIDPNDKIKSIENTISVWVGQTYDALIKQSFNGYLTKQMKQSEAKVFFSQNLMLNFMYLLDYLKKQVDKDQVNKDQIDQDEVDEEEDNPDQINSEQADSDYDDPFNAEQENVVQEQQLDEDEVDKQQVDEDEDQIDQQEENDDQVNSETVDKVEQDQMIKFIQFFEKKSQQTLCYYLDKYPQKSKISIDPIIKQQIKQSDISASPDYNALICLKCQMQYQEKGDYSSQIKKFINALIKQSSKNYSNFSSLMKKIFTFQQNQQNDMQKQIGEKLSQPQKQVVKPSAKKSPEPGPQVKRTQVRQGQARKQYKLDHKISMKFKKGTPLYTPQEIKKTGVEIKAPEVLRVLMKWIQELQQIINNPRKYFSRAATQLKQAAQGFGQWQKKNKKLITSVCKQLSSYCSTVLDQLNNISAVEIMKTLPAYAVSEVVASTAMKKLNQLLRIINHALYQVQYRFKQVSKSDLEIIPFTVGDLLRCRCSGTVSEVIQVIRRLRNNSEKIQIVRIKDRLKTGNQDFLVNFKMEGCGVLCEMQIGFIAEADQKMEFLDHFNHFLYQLKRSEYGPLAQSTLMVSNLTRFNGFYSRTLKNIHSSLQKSNLKATSTKIDQIEIQGYDCQPNSFSFICSNCLLFRKAYSTFLPVFINKKSYAFICGECAFELLTPQQKSICLLGQLGKYFIYQSTKQEMLFYDLYKIVIPKQQIKFIQVLQKFSNGDNKDERVYAHVFYEQNPDIFYQNTNSFDKMFCLTFDHKYSPIIRLDTLSIREQMDKDTNMVKLSDLTTIQNQITSDIEDLSIPRKVVFVQETITLEKITAPHLWVYVFNDQPEMIILNAYEQEGIEKAVKKWQFKNITKKSEPTWNIQKMSISESMLKTIEVKHTLQKLKLNNNDICSLDLFKCQCQTLHYLDVRDNKIKEIQNFNKQFPKLKTLKISKNQLINIQGVESFSQLRVLKANGNRINKVSLSSLPKRLQKLDLSKNEIEDVEDVSSDLQLIELNLSRNKLDKLVMKNLPKMLQKLNLSHNKFENIEGSGSNIVVTQLNISFNKFKVADFTNVSMPNLTLIDISFNELKKLVFPSEKFKKLKKIKASHNILLTQVDLTPVDTLEYVEIDHCKLHYINLSNEKLIKIKLSHNSLEELKFSKQLPNLTYIDVGFNKLKELDLTRAYPLDSLTQIYASNNEIKQIKYIPPINLKKFHLDRNPDPLRFVPSFRWQFFTKLKELNVGDSQLGLQFINWFIRNVPEKKLQQFINYCGKQQKQANIERIKSVHSGLQEFSKDQAEPYSRLIYKYFKIDEKGKKQQINLVENQEKLKQYIID